MPVERVKTIEAEIGDLPIVGSHFAKIGRIINMISNPCAPDVELWAYGFFTALPTMVVTLTKPELIDINIRKHGRRNKRGRKMRIHFTDIFRDSLIDVPVPRYAVFQLGELAQRVGWYFLVADATEDFVINWASLAYQWTGCPGEPATPGFRVEVTDATIWQAGGAVTDFPNNQGGITYLHDVTQVPGQIRFRLDVACIPRFNLEVETQVYAPNPDTAVTNWKIWTSALPFAIAEGRMSGDGKGGSTYVERTLPNLRYPAGTEFWVTFSKTTGGIGMKRYLWSMLSAFSPLEQGYKFDP